MEGDSSLITYPSWTKYIVLSKVIDSLTVKDKRTIFNIMRKTPNLSQDTFMPTFGFTTGEFAIWQILSTATKSTR